MKSVFTTNLGHMMREKGMNQREVAEKIGVSDVRMSRIMHGEREPNEVEMHNLCALFGVDRFAFYFANPDLVVKKGIHVLEAEAPAKERKQANDGLPRLIDKDKFLRDIDYSLEMLKTIFAPEAGKEEDTYIKFLRRTMEGFRKIVENRETVDISSIRG